MRAPEPGAVGVFSPDGRGGFTAPAAGQDGRCGYLHHDGAWLAAPTLSYTEGFDSGGLSRFQGEDGRWGYAGTDGLPVKAAAPEEAGLFRVPLGPSGTDRRALALAVHSAGRGDGRPERGSGAGPYGDTPGGGTAAPPTTSGGVVLICDDFAMRRLTLAQAGNLYELVSERQGRSLIITSNRAPSDWFPLLPTPSSPSHSWIHQRPSGVNDRKTPGHWEGDLIIGRGQGSAIGALVERTTRYVHLIHLPHGGKAPQVRNALVAHSPHSATERQPRSCENASQVH